MAAYNAGEHNVDIWVEPRRRRPDFDPKTDIPFPETRGYVESVMRHRVLVPGQVPAELGLD